MDRCKCLHLKSDHIRTDQGLKCLPESRSQKCLCPCTVWRPTTTWTCPECNKILDLDQPIMSRAESADLHIKAHEWGVQSDLHDLLEVTINSPGVPRALRLFAREIRSKELRIGLLRNDVDKILKAIRLTEDAEDLS